MNKILVIAGHPDYKHSVANRAVLDEFHKLAPQADIVYLDALYPDFNIDVEKEQKRISDADIVIFQFPFWWYGSPSLMHRYVEKVFTHGFAYGSEGKALHGKKFIASFTVGGPQDAYTAEGYQHYTLDQFLPPFRAMSNLCGMEWIDPVYEFGMMTLGPDDTERIAEVTEKAHKMAHKLAELIK